jgi:hypothetical protein
LRERPWQLGPRGGLGGLESARPPAPARALARAAGPPESRVAMPETFGKIYHFKFFSDFFGVYVFTYFSFSTHSQCLSSQLYITLVFFPKNFRIWRDSNPGILGKINKNRDFDFPIYKCLVG